MNIVGTGIDIVSVGRLSEKIDKTPALAERILTSAELDYCRAKKNCVEHMAGRFAAKEAIFKAVGGYIDRFNFKDIEIESAGSPPSISFDCRLAGLLKKESFAYSISISHEKDYAVASAVFWKDR